MEGQRDAQKQVNEQHIAMHLNQQPILIEIFAIAMPFYCIYASAELEIYILNIPSPCVRACVNSVFLDIEIR